MVFRDSWLALRAELSGMQGPLNRRQTVVLGGAVLIAAVSFTILYVERETPTWFWDYANYHEKYKELIDNLYEGIFPFLQQVRRSVLQSQHNLTSVLPLLPGRLLLGPHRVGYIVSLVIFYLLPACLLTAALARSVWWQPGAHLPALALTGFALLYSPYWAPTLRGHPDVVCVLPLASATLLLIQSRYLLDATPGRALLIGLLLWCSFLLRRHVLFTVASLVAACLVFAGVLALRRRRRHQGLGRGRWPLNMVCMLATMVIPALVFQHSYLQEILNPNYGSTFGAYQQSLASQLQELWAFFGPLLLGSAVLGTLVALAWRRDGILFCGSVAVLALLGFQAVQAPSDQHLLILSLFLFPAACAPLVLIDRHLDRPLRHVLTGLWFLLPGAAFLHTFPLQARSLPQSASVWSVVAPARTYPPLRLASYRQVKQLVADLRRLAEARGENVSFAILASSDQLNSHIVRALSRRKLRERLISVSDVDRRDAFQLKTLETDYIVATDPPAIHLGESEQRVITIPSRALRTAGNPLNRAYRHLPGLDQRLADGSVASIYERIQPPSEEEVIWLHREFRRCIPSWQRYPTHIGKPRGGF